MINWIRKLFGLCQHKWVIIAQKNYLWPDSEQIAQREFTLQCEHCGNIKVSRT